MAIKLETLIDHSDKIALGVGAILFVTMVGLSATSGNTAKIDTMRQDVDKVESRIDDVNKKIPAASLGQTKPGEEFREKLSLSLQPATFPAWAMDARPLILRDVKQKPTAVQCSHQPPVIYDPTVKRGSIDIKWKRSDETNRVDIVSYTIFRGVNLSDPENEKDKFEKVAEVTTDDLGEMTWTDNKVQPEITYCYYVRSQASPSKAAVQHSGGFVFTDPRDLDSSVTPVVSTPPERLIWIASVRHEDPEYPDDELDKIEVQVARYDAAAGQFQKKKRYFDLVVGPNPDKTPTVIGEGEFETNWILYEVGKGQVKIKHRTSGQIETKKVGAEGKPDGWP